MECLGKLLNSGFLTWIISGLCYSLEVKTNDFNLYGECLHLMANIFFSFDGQNCAWYLIYFSVFVAYLEETNTGATELLQRGAISVAISFIPGNRCAVDKTMKACEESKWCRRKWYWTKWDHWKILCLPALGSDYPRTV